MSESPSASRSHETLNINKPSGAEPPQDIGVVGALSIGVGGIVGGGFFATFGLAVVGARGSTYLSFLLGGLLALLTAYSYVRLTLRYPGPAGTAGFVRRAFGRSLLPASINVLLIYSYIAIMAVYAHALASYAASYFPEEQRGFWLHLLASASIVLLGFVNFAGASLMAKFEDVFNVGKLGVLGLFIFAGFLLGRPEWSRLGASEWVGATRIVSSGIIVFLAYEGFELISNASARIRDPAVTLPIALYGSVIAAIVIYSLVVIVAIGHMPFDAIKQAQDFALSATAERFMGSFGFALLTAGAVLASASAINADFFGASKLPVMLSEHGEMPPQFSGVTAGKHLASTLFVGCLALAAVNFVELAALSAATSAGFLVVYAAVNLANVKLAAETKSNKWLALAAALVCVVAIAVTLYDFASEPASRISAVAMLAIVLLAIVSEKTFRIFWPARLTTTELVRDETAHYSQAVDGRRFAPGRNERALLGAALALATLGCVSVLIWRYQNDQADQGQSQGGVLESPTPSSTERTASPDTPTLEPKPGGIQTEGATQIVPPPSGLPDATAKSSAPETRQIAPAKKKAR